MELNFTLKKSLTNVLFINKFSFNNLKKNITFIKIVRVDANRTIYADLME